MEDPEKNFFESRPYQTELFEQAVEKNLILYLPTGSGKTFIAILLIKEFSKVDNVLSKPLVAGGKRTFFLVNTVSLVEQQAKQVEKQTCFHVGRYSGDMGVDLWAKSTWLDEINSNQILVMTCQIFVDLIQSNTISLKNVNLLIFDECHRGVSNHPMRQAMKQFKNVPYNEQPRVLGLTATLLNGNIKPENVENEIRCLENTYMAQIATSINEDMVRRHSTNPKEAKVTYQANDTSGYCYVVRNTILENCKNFVMAIETEKINKMSGPADTRQIDTNHKKINKNLKNMIDDIQVNMDDLGIYGGSLAILAHLVQIQQLLPNVQLETSKMLYQCISVSCVSLRRRLEHIMYENGRPQREALEIYSSDKVKKLLNILKKLKTTDSAIIFVERRFTAKILYYTVKKAAEIEPRLKHIKSNFIVGSNISNPLKDTRENYLQKNQNKKVLNLFNSGELNVLIASNVVEEGLDISKCNYVIMFDASKDFRGYIQSKGRCRDKNSHYIIMNCATDPKFEPRYRSFCAVESTLKQILCGGKSLYRTAPTSEEINAQLFIETPGLEDYRPKGKNGPVVTALSAIPLVYRYFLTLKRDKFTKITPYWWLQEKNGKYKCFLQLPMESKVRGHVEGTWQSNQENAKRSVALEACKKLHKAGELDDKNLLPIDIKNTDITGVGFTPNIDSSEQFETEIGEKKIKVGTNKYKRTCEKKWPECLSHCRPQPNEEAYLHVFDVQPVTLPPSDNTRLTAVYSILSSPNQFALLSTKKLPKLASFPLYMSIGELEAKIKDVHPIVLSRDELKRIIDFHSCIFDNVLCVAKKFMIRDMTNTQNAFLIAPILLGPSHEINIDWNVIDVGSKFFPPTNFIPSEEDRRSLIITDENYVGKVVSPWYRTVPAQKYIVTKVCYNMSEETKFPTETYATYKEYFEEKYKIKPLKKNQPLLEVRALSSKLNSIKPRALTKTLKRKNKEENEEFEVWLLPEFCVVYPLPGRYWMKSLLLPSILHRITQMCMAEELRCTIAHNTGVGIINLPPDMNWDKLKEDRNLPKNESVCEKDQALTPLLFIFNNNDYSKYAATVWGEEEEPVDVERNMDSVTLFDVKNYAHFIERPLLGDYTKLGVGISPQQLSRSKRRPKLVMVEPPPLKMLQNTTSGIGPQQIEVMQALTAAVANDFINCERLETLGDAFLKFAISLTLFETQSDLAEGHLTYLKGVIVGNKNLFFCGKKKNIGSMLEVHDFSPTQDWVPPGFFVDYNTQCVHRQAKLNPSWLYNIEIPEAERAAGKLGIETFDLFNELLFEAEDVVQPQTSTFINLQALTDKNISDAVEAILGVYLKSCGLFGALEVLNWFGVTNPALSTKEVFNQKSLSPAKNLGNPNKHLIQPDDIEEILNYKFRDKSYLLQALSHPSYTRNDITLCYQRLEFLGDAVIDFLITIHIYEKCTSLSPGDLTDLRSALVNNITLACISVRNEFHKFLIHSSKDLNDCMMRFVNHQENRNHIIDNDVLFLLEENDVNIAEAIEVPKALGDIFEAIIGAIFLDSGKNINVTWKVIYNLMRSEIEKFHKDVPKNHVRMLYESDSCPSFTSYVQPNGIVLVTVDFIHNGASQQCNGFGENKKEAKRAAAKHALRVIRSPDNK